MKGRLTIAIDIDDVIVESSPYLVEHYNKVYGTNLRLEDMYSDDLKRWMVTDRAAAIARVEEYLATDEFQGIPPLQEATKSIQRLAKKHELHIITGRSLAIEVATTGMLHTYFPGIFRSVTFTSMYGRKGRSKKEICQELGADLLIEDHLGHALPVARCGIDVLLFGDYPWNQADVLPGNIRRAKNWAEVEEFVNAES
jgi:uncharacterized HAD superfamily protein